MKDEIFINSDPGIGRVPLDTICAANEGRFNSTFYSEPLTTYGVGGWDKDDLQLLLEFLAPSCEVSRYFTYKQADIADAFLTDDGAEDIRAIGGDFQRVQDGLLTDVVSRTDNKGLTISIDLDVAANDPNYRNKKVTALTRRLLRNEIRRAIAGLDAAGISTAKVWSGTADPDRDVKDELDTSALTGNRANRVLYGSTAWSLRDSTYRAQNTAGSNASAGMMVDRVGQYLAASTQTMDALYRTGSGNLAAFLSNAVFLYNAASGLTPEDPSNIKRFTSNGGTPMQVYSQQVSAKREEITVCHYSLLAVTSTIGIRKLTTSKV
ncbi:MAG: hypothetical protein WC378_11860 [Opitutaceae bacterium]|jgi:hypothetical protein